MVSFSEGLWLFTVILIPVYLAIQLVSDRSAGPEPRLFTDETKSMLSSISMVSLALLTFALLHAPGFKESSTYPLLIVLMTALLLYVIGMKHDSATFRGLILFSALLLHIIVLYTPPYGLILDERSPALARMAIEGFYDPSRPLLNPIYNPFPMDVGLLLMFTEVSGLSPIAELSFSLISLSLVLVIDIVLYSLVRRLTGNWTVGVLAILIFAITPPANFIGHHAKLAGLMLVFVATFMLALEHQGRGSPWKSLTGKLAYVSGIFYHATAGLGMFIVSGILATGFMLKHFMREQEWEEMFKSSMFRITLATFVVITFARWIYGGGFELIVPSLRNYTLQMLEWDEGGGVAAPLYERAGVNPIQAYAWSTPVAMAISLVLYTIIRRKASHGALIPSMAIGSGVFLLIGLTGGYFRAGGFAPSMYPGFGLLMPAAAVVAWKALHSSRISALLLIGLLTASAVVAVQDPMLSPWRILEIRSDRPGGTEQYFIASTLASITTSGKDIKAPNEILQSIRYLNPYAKARYFVGEPSDPKYSKDYALLLQGQVEANTLYVLRLEQVPRSLLDDSLYGSRIVVVFNSGGYVGFIESK